MLTVPNLLSVLRLLGVPLFLWLLLAEAGTPTSDVWAIVVLGARRHQRLGRRQARPPAEPVQQAGELLDPAVDRLYILAALLGLGLRGVVPWWAVGVLVGRDLVLAVCLPLLRRRGYGPPPVVYLGKAATFLLLWTFPLLLAGLQTGLVRRPLPSDRLRLRRLGSALYLYTGALYLAQIVLALRTPRAHRAREGLAEAPAVIPDDLRYTDAHEWVRDLGDGKVRIGITDHAQSQLGDVVFVQLPDEGADVQAGAAVGEVESTKSVSELFAPVSGTVVAVNAALADTPELINSAPYEDGWMLDIRVDATRPRDCSTRTRTASSSGSDRARCPARHAR